MTFPNGTEEPSRQRGVGTYRVFANKIILYGEFDLLLPEEVKVVRQLQIGLHCVSTVRMELRMVE